MTSSVDDKLAAICHVKFLSAKSITFYKGGSIIMGWVEVGVLHMRSFQDLKVIKTVLIAEAHYFYNHHKKQCHFCMISFVK